MPSIVIGKVRGEQGEAGVSPTVTLTKEENTLTISVTDAEGTTNGSVAVNGTDVSVKGLDTMAYQKAEDYVTLDSVVLATADDLAGLFPTT